MSIFTRPMPLACNRPAFEKAVELKKTKVGLSLEAKGYQKEIGKKLASVWETKDNSKFLLEYKKLAGAITNLDIDIMLLTDSIATALFEIVPFTGQNIPAYSIWVTPGVNVTRMSSRANPPQVVKYQSATQYFPALYYISTDKIYQPTAGILSGEIGPSDKINQMAQYEMQQTIEDDIWALLAASIGSFTMANTYQYDSRIQNVPTTNAITLSSAGGLTIQFFRDLMAKIDLTPSRTRPGEVAMLRNLLVPNVAVSGIRDWVSMVSTTSGQTQTQDGADAVTQELHRQIESGGPMISSLWGDNLGLVKRNTLMGTSAANFSKFLWGILDGPIGRLYVKTDEDRSQTWDDQLPYMTGISLSKMIGMEIPDPYKPNFFLAQFKS